MSDREFDIVVFGATGFTGELVCRYLAEKRGAGELSWAVAGRNREKLNDYADELARTYGMDSPGVVVADVSDDTTLEAMAARANVLITTVGPYADFGEPVVAACVREGAHYLDLTGEPEFWWRIIRNYHDEAAERGVRLVSCCGFDSIPADIGTWFALSRLGEHRPATVRSYFKAKGTASGGTWASLLEAFGNAREFAGKRSSKGSDDAPEKTQKKASKRSVTQKLVAAFPLKFVDELDTWALAMPTIDPAVVRRSASQCPEYGDRFRYEQYLVVGSFVEGLGLLSAVAGLFVAAQSRPVREYLKSRRPSGAGPSAEERAKSWFRVALLAESGDEAVQCEVAGGDPGYTETAKMISECALAIVENADQLPDRAGVLTTASAFGDVLVDRLRLAGIDFRWFRPDPPKAKKRGVLSRLGRK